MNKPILTCTFIFFAALQFSCINANSLQIPFGTKKGMKANHTLNIYRNPIHIYYGEVSVMGGYNGFSVATMHGYKFTQFACLGISVGYNLFVIKDVFPQLDHVDASYQFKGLSMLRGFFTTKIAFSTDWMHTKYTPYTQLELGYAFPIRSYEIDPYYVKRYLSAYSSNIFYKGGPTESIIIGVKRNTRKHSCYKLGVEVSILTNISKYSTYNHDNHTEKQGVVSTSKVGIGGRFTIGF